MLKKVQESLKDLNLNDDENIISVDAFSFLPTCRGNRNNISYRKKNYDSDCVEPPPMLEKTKKTLLEMVSIDVVSSKMDGAFYRQTEWVVLVQTTLFLVQYENEMGSNSTIRYVNNVIRSLITAGKQIFSSFVNTCHRKLTIVFKEPSVEGLLFRDPSMKKINSKIVSICYGKSPDTGVILIVSAIVGFVLRIFNANSNGKEFNKSWTEAENIMTNNQYP